MPEPAPLEGLRVVEITNIYSGPLAGLLLAELGADVIKVEGPETPDFVRAGGGADPDGVNPMFYALNRGKRFVALDAKKPEGRELLVDLAASADVFLHNIRPGKPEQLGVGYAELAARNPALIYAAISGLGIDGPEAANPVYDYVVQARIGMVDYQRDLDTGKADLVHHVVVDKTTAMAAVQSILAALLVRGRTGKGQRIDIPMLGAGTAFFWPDGMANFFSQLDPPIPPDALVGHLNGLPGAGLMVLSTKDGEIATSPMLPPWDGLCLALDRLDWVTDPRFEKQGSRAFNIPALKAEIAGEVAKYTTAEVLARFEEFGVAAGPVLRRREVHEDAQIQHTGTLLVRDTGFIGEVRQPAPMWHFSATPALVTGSIGRTGEHTREVLAEHGLSGERLDALFAAGVLTAPAG